MRRGVVVVALTVALLFVGAALLKAFGEQSTSDPTASARNGAPRGFLGLALLLDKQDRRPELLARFDDAWPPVDPERPLTMLVPPPERADWTEAEAKALMDRVSAGDRLVLACDDESARNDRLKPLLGALGVECYRADIALGDESVTKGTGALPGYARQLHVRGTGRVRPRPHSTAFPAWLAGNESVVVRRAVGAGTVTVLGSATVLANDGIAVADNAAFALDVLGAGGAVVVDERHHGSRGRATLLSAAGRGSGPLTALALLALLVPLSLLGLAPRPGDAPRADEGHDGAPAALAQARALAALLAHVEERGKRR